MDRHGGLGSGHQASIEWLATKGDTVTGQDHSGQTPPQPSAIRVLARHIWLAYAVAMVMIRTFCLTLCLGAGIVLVGCSTGGDIGSRSGAQPAQASWACTKGVSLSIRRSSTGLEVTDSRGFTVDLPPDPPGQRERYAQTGYALVFAGRTASWFAAGNAPTDCRR